jgi:hypothetical protein
MKKLNEEGSRQKLEKENKEIRRRPYDDTGQNKERADNIKSHKLRIFSFRKCPFPLTN